MNNFLCQYLKGIFCLVRPNNFLLLLFVFAFSLTVSAETLNSEKIESDYLQELEKNNYGEIKPPQKPPVFRWDFSKTNIQTYSFEQETIKKTEINTDIKNASGSPDTNMSIKGHMLVKSQADGTADLVFKDIKAIFRIALDKKEESKTIEQAIPPFVVQGIKEDWTGAFEKSQQTMLLNLTFPLPPKVLNPGEYVDIPHQLPFNALGSHLQVKGYSRLILSKYVLVEKKMCAQFNVDINISDLKLPPELEGKYSCSMKGTAVFFFDINNRSFVSGTAVLVTQTKIDTLFPETNIQGEKASANKPSKVQMSMKEDTFIRILSQE